MKAVKKVLKFGIPIVAMLLISTVSWAQKGASKTTFQVAGKCGHCKERIETALDVKGVSKVDWNAKLGTVTVLADTSIISPSRMQKHVADAGHDTPLHKAQEKTYNALPSCCHYERMK